MTAIPALLLLLLAPAPPAKPAAEPCTSNEASDAPACAAAIAAANNGADKAALLYQRAYAASEQDRSEDALRDLDEALAYEFRNASYLEERAFVLNRLGEHGRAVADLDRRIALGGEIGASVYSERAFARLRAGDLAGAWEDRDRVVKLRPDDAWSLVTRAQSELWLGRFEDARRDLDSAAKLASRGKRDKKLLDGIAEGRADLANWTGGSGPRKPEACAREVEAEHFAATGLVADCTAAFLAARTPHDRAQAISNRAFAWVIGLNDTIDGWYDRQVAAGLEPDNADLLYLLGMSYYDADRPDAAKRLFERSLAVEKTAAALAGRGAARFQLGDKAGAEADARAADAMRTNPMANLVLARLALDSGDRATAKRYWMDSWHRGWIDDNLRARLKEIGIVDPDKEPKP